MTAKRRKSGSVLSRQKPRRSGKRGLPNWVKPLFVACAALALVLTGRYLWKRHVPRLFPAGELVDWKVQLKVGGETALDERLADKVLEVARDNLGKQQTPKLDRAADAVLKLDLFSRVHVLQRSKDEVVVNVRLRHPLLCIEADKRRLVSEDGDVYGSADDQPCPGPIVTGILDAPGLRYATRGDHALALTKEDQSLVREAVDLWKGAREKGYAVSVVDFKRHRGFAVTMPAASEGFEVALGRAPFDTKLSKLRDILDKLAAKGEQAVRIELDYHGKAFIKSKKM